MKIPSAVGNGARIPHGSHRAGALLVVVAGMVAGCDRPATAPAQAGGPGQGTPSTAAAAPASAAPTQVHSTTGLVRQIAADRRTAVIRHEEIPGYMPRMTMELNIRTTNELAGIAAGDTIAFRLSANGETHWIDQIRRLEGLAVENVPAPAVGPAGPDPVGAARAGAGAGAGAVKPVQLKVGDPMPAARLKDEDGRTFALEELRGEAIAFTFFFTRCPLPDFCPRMNQNLSAARKLLAEDAGGPANWRLLSISFDPEFDQPPVLKSHARVYRGDDTNRWLFAVADAATLRDLAPRLDLRMAREGGSISHNLRTVVLDAQGRVHRQFDGNRWTAAELAGAVAEAARVR